LVFLVALVVFDQPSQHALLLWLPIESTYRRMIDWDRQDTFWELVHSFQFYLDWMVREIMSLYARK
jgi:hypothetical protein